MATAAPTDQCGASGNAPAVDEDSSFRRLPGRRLFATALFVRLVGSFPSSIHRNLLGNGVTRHAVYSNEASKVFVWMVFWASTALSSSSADRAGILPPTGESTMTEFKLHDVTSAPEGSRPILEATQAAWQFLPNLHRVL